MREPGYQPIGNHKVHGYNAPLSGFIACCFEPRYRGFVVDVGASDGVSCNTTFALEKWYGWKTLCVEANPQFGASLKANRSLFELCACGAAEQREADFYIHLDYAEAYSSLRPNFKFNPRGLKPDAAWETIQVPVKTLNTLLAKHEFPKLDALCIDTEGTEADVLRGLDLEKWHPLVVIVESWDGPGEADQVLKPRQYGRIGRIYDNDIYMRMKH